MNLVHEDALVLSELEQYIGEVIPEVKTFGGGSTSSLYRTAYTHEDGRLNYLSICTPCWKHSVIVTIYRKSIL